LHERRAASSDRFLWIEGVPGAEVHTSMSVLFRNSVVSRRGASEWIETLKMFARTSVKHEARAERATEGNGAWVACLSAENFLF
jgi:hypothetical protein